MQMRAKRHARRAGLANTITGIYFLPNLYFDFGAVRIIGIHTVSMIQYNQLAKGAQTAGVMIFGIHYDAGRSCDNALLSAFNIPPVMAPVMCATVAVPSVAPTGILNRHRPFRLFYGKIIINHFFFIFLFIRYRNFIYVASFFQFWKLQGTVYFFQIELLLIYFHFLFV